MKTVSLILARGGSKGVPQKNIKELNGAPLISYVIETSLNSNVDETWVSTDCQDIRDVALDCGANVSKRPEEFATITSTILKPLTDSMLSISPFSGTTKISVVSLSFVTCAETIEFPFNSMLLSGS